MHDLRVIVATIADQHVRRQPQPIERRCSRSKNTTTAVSTDWLSNGQTIAPDRAILASSPAVLRSVSFDRRLRRCLDGRSVD
jgi:hypothetical protein